MQAKMDCLKYAIFHTILEKAHSQDALSYTGTQKSPLFNVDIDIFFNFKCAKSKRLRKVLQLFFYYTMVAI